MASSAVRRRPFCRTPSTQLLNRGAVAHLPLARAAPPPPSSAPRPSRVRDHRQYDQRCQILVIVQCRRRHDRFGARAKPGAVSGHHPRTTRMSSCGGECRAGRTLLRGGRVAGARRRSSAPRAGIAQSPPTNDRRRPPRGGRPLPHRSIAQVAYPAGRSPLLIAVHGLALRKASDAISPINAVVEPGCCRSPPPSSRRAATTIIGATPLARARPQTV